MPRPGKKPTAGKGPKFAGHSSAPGAVGASSGQKAMTNQEILENMPPKFKKSYNQMFSLYDSGKYADGVECCEKLLQQYPGFPDAKCMLGICIYYVPVKKFLGLCEKGVFQVLPQWFEELEGGAHVAELLRAQGKSAQPKEGPRSTQSSQAAAPAAQAAEAAGSAERPGKGGRAEKVEKAEQEPSSEQVTSDRLLSGIQITHATRFLHALAWKLIRESQEATKGDTHVPFHIAALLSRTEGKASQALGFYQKATEIFSNSSTLVRDLGIQYFLAKDYAAADLRIHRSLLLSISSGKPDEQNVRTQLTLAIYTHYMQKKYQGCLNSIRELIEHITTSCTHSCFDRSRSQRMTLARANGYHSCWRDVRAAEAFRAEVLELMARSEAEDAGQGAAKEEKGKGEPAKEAVKETAEETAKPPADKPAESEAERPAGNAEEKAKEKPGENSAEKHASDALATLNLIQSAGLSEDVSKGLANVRYDIERQCKGIIRLTVEEGSRLPEPARSGARQARLKALHFLYRKNPANGSTLDFLSEEARAHGASAKDLYTLVVQCMESTPVCPESFSEALGGTRGKDGYPEPVKSSDRGAVGANGNAGGASSAGVSDPANTASVSFPGAAAQSSLSAVAPAASTASDDHRTAFDDSSLDDVVRQVFDDLAFTPQIHRSLLRLRLAIRAEERASVEKEISGFLLRHCGASSTCAYGMFDLVANLIRTECEALPRPSGEELLGHALSHLLTALIKGQDSLSKCMLIRALTELPGDPLLSEEARQAAAAISIFNLLGLSVPVFDSELALPIVEHYCYYKLYLNGTYTNGKKDKAAREDPAKARLRYFTRAEYDSDLAREQRELYRCLFPCPAPGGESELISLSAADVDAYIAACRYLGNTGYPRTAARLSHLVSLLNPVDKCLASRCARYYLEALELDSGLAMYGRFMYKSDPFISAQDNQDWDFLVAVAECCVQRMSAAGYLGQEAAHSHKLPPPREFFMALKAVYEIMISAADELEDTRSLVWYGCRQSDVASYLDSTLHAQSIILSRPELSYAIQMFLSLLLEGLVRCGCVSTEGAEAPGSEKVEEAPAAAARPGPAPEVRTWLSTASKDLGRYYSRAYERLAAGDREDSDGDKIERLADLDPYLTDFFGRLLSLATVAGPEEAEARCGAERMFGSEDSDRRLKLTLGAYGDYLLGPASPFPDSSAEDMRGLGQLCKILALSLSGKVLLAVKQAKAARLCPGKRALARAFALKGLGETPEMLRKPSAEAVASF